MKLSLNSSLSWVAIIFAVSIAIPNVFAQPVPSLRDAQEATQQARYQEKMLQILNDKEGYATAIVRRWEADARATVKWDENYSTDLLNALMKLQPDNLLAAGEASSYEGVLRVLKTGRAETISPKGGILPAALGDFSDDLVFTPVQPCRIVDTRVAGGAIGQGETRLLEADSPSGFAAQGGSATNCNIPDGVATAVAVVITATQPTAAGYFTAWAIGASQPLSSNLNWATGQTIAATSIVPIVPGAGADWDLFSGGGNVHAIVDIVGYYARPVATALDCTQVSSGFTAVPVNSYTNVDAFCPAGRSATGGGSFSNEGTLGYPGVWTFTLPNGSTGWRTWVDNQTNGPRNVQTWVQCCRIPGR